MLTRVLLAGPVSARRAPSKAAALKPSKSAAAARPRVAHQPEESTSSSSAASTCGCNESGSPGLGHSKASQQAGHIGRKRPRQDTGEEDQRAAKQQAEAAAIARASRAQARSQGAVTRKLFPAKQQAGAGMSMAMAAAGPDLRAAPKPAAKGPAKRGHAPKLARRHAKVVTKQLKRPAAAAVAAKGLLGRLNSIVMALRSQAPQLRRIRCQRQA